MFLRKIICLVFIFGSLIKGADLDREKTDILLLKKNGEKNKNIQEQNFLYLITNFFFNFF